MLRIHDSDILLFNPWIIHALYMPFCVTWHIDDSCEQIRLIKLIINELYFECKLYQVFQKDECHI